MYRPPPPTSPQPHYIDHVNTNPSSTKGYIYFINKSFLSLFPFDINESRRKMSYVVYVSNYRLIETCIEMSIRMSNGFIKFIIIQTNELLLI